MSQRKQQFATDYIHVATRIVQFREQHPEGSLQPADPTNPYRIEEVAGQTFIVFVAAAYRSPDDQRPGIGTAWEPFPGPTPYTRNSELQNAETSAWGRAIVAALAADTKKGIASAEEVRNRSAERDEPKADEQQLLAAQLEALAKVLDTAEQAGVPDINRATVLDYAQKSYANAVAATQRLGEKIDQHEANREDAA